MSTLILMDVALLVTLMVLGVPVAMTFVAAAAFLVIFGDYNSTTFLITSGYSKVSSVVLLAIPLYILAGGIMTQGGIAKRLLDLADSILGRYRSGLGVVTVITTAIFWRDFGHGLIGCGRDWFDCDPEDGRAGLRPRIRDLAGQLLGGPGSSDPAKCDDDPLWMGNWNFDCGLFPCTTICPPVF